MCRRRKAETERWRVLPPLLEAELVSRCFEKELEGRQWGVGWQVGREGRDLNLSIPAVPFFPDKGL